MGKKSNAAMVAGGKNVTFDETNERSRDASNKREQAQSKKGTVASSSASPSSNPRNTRSDRSGNALDGSLSANQSRIGAQGVPNVDSSDVSSAGQSGASGARTRGTGRGKGTGRQNEIHDHQGRGNQSSSVSNVPRNNHLTLPSGATLLDKTWQSLFDDLCPQCKPFYLRIKAESGIVGVIKTFDEVAKVIINEKKPPLVLADLYYAITKYCDMRTALQLLRFGKRYTPDTWTPSEEKEIIAAFRDRNNRIKMIDRREYPTWFVTLVAPIAEGIWNAALRGRSFTSYIAQRSLTVDLRNLPSGTTAEGLRNPFEKWAYVKTLWSDFDANILAGISDDRWDSDIPTRPSALKMVPKDYRGPRIIMEEPLLRTLQQTPIADGLLKLINTPSLSRYCPYGHIRLEDQEYNQELARIGAENGYYATIDLSNASDSISYKLLYLALTPQIAEHIAATASKYVVLPSGETLPLYIPCTMGSRNTVPGQSGVYWTLISAGVELAYRDGVCNRHIIHDCAVYNDDIVVPSVIYEYVLLILRTAGLIVNEDKSYTGDAKFRESCGYDGFDGVEVTTSYWPRRGITSYDDIISLCALQNRLYELGAERASQYVYNQVKRCMPGFPVNREGSTETCLYGDMSTTVYQPYKAYTSSPVVFDVDVDVEIQPYHVVGLSECVMLRTVVITDHNKPLGKFDSRRNCKVSRVCDIANLCSKSNIWRIDIRLKSLPFTKHRFAVSPQDCFNDMPLTKVRTMYEVPGIVSAYDSQVVQTYDNRKRSRIFDSKRITDTVLSELLEQFEYEHWLLNGSEYYDDLCRYLHVTSPSRMAKRLYPKGYTLRKTRFTTIQPID